MTTDRERRAVAAVHGLALGDALGAPASEHRTIHDPFVRQTLRRGRAELDAELVLRPVVPFVLSALGTQSLVGTDDTELFAVAALAILEAGPSDAGALFASWRRLMSVDGTWTGTAQRSALLNADEGLLPPLTGRDNPAFYDDTALPGALAAAVASEDPAEASALARTLAEITHDGVGVDAAGLFAAVVSRALRGEALARALDAELASSDLDDWLLDGIADARRILDEHATMFAAVPALVARFAPRTYSHPGTVTETLPLALALAERADGDHERAMPLAFSITRHQDSLPALVGALCGAVGSAVDAGPVDVVSGVTIPSVAGRSLRDLAASLLASSPAHRG